MVNPFNPGAGRRPPYLAGRDQMVRSIKADMNRVYANGEGARPVVVSGLRGMGKTVLLRELADYAKAQGWLVLWAEAARSDSLAKKILQSAYPELRRAKNSANPFGGAFDHAMAVLKSFQLKIDPVGTFSFGMDIAPAKGYADSGDLALDLTDLFQALGEAAREAGTAVFVAADELQEAPREDLSALNMALHAVGQGAAPVPLYFLGAGLPTLPSVLADASSYAERMYRFYTLDLLSDADVEEAYARPAEDAGLIWDEDALRKAVLVAQGYPYFIQQCGFSVCEQLDAPGAITLSEVTDGVELAMAELDSGLYRSRWDRATPAGKDFLKAMAQDEGPSKMTELAQRLGREPSALYPLRDRLIGDGLIYSPTRGFVAFTVPGMGSFVKRHEF